MKQVKQLTMAFILILGFAAQSAHAVLVDQGDITLDDVNNMEWLDLTFTDNMTISTALSTYGSQGWEVATRTQYQNMFDSYVNGYIDNGSGMMQVQPTTPQYDQIQEFITLFGQTALTASTGWNGAFGFYLDSATDSGIAHLGGMYDGIIFGNLYRDLLADRSLEAYTNGNNAAGIFMVRAAAVPEASTLAMLAIGLLGFSFARRRKA